VFVIHGNLQVATLMTRVNSSQCTVFVGFRKQSSSNLAGESFDDDWLVTKIFSLVKTIVRKHWDFSPPLNQFIPQYRRSCMTTLEDKPLASSHRNTH
jgi:hypothetical protein